MDIKELETHWRSLYSQLEALTTPPDDFDDPEAWSMPDESRARFDELETEIAVVEGQIETTQRRKAVIARSNSFEPGDSQQVAGGDLFHINRDRDPYDTATIALDADLPNLRGRVATGLERDAVTPDAVKDQAMKTLARVSGDKKAVAARYLATGSVTYRNAFAKLMSGQANQWTDNERQMVARAQTLTDAAGGFAVPFTLDPTIIGIDGLSFNPIRNIARVVQTTTDTWNGVTGTAVSFSWDAEEAQVSDDAITLAQPSIPVYKLAGFVPFSIEVGADWADIDSDLRMAMMEGRDNAEATAHAKGTGSAQPTGIEVELDGTASEISPATAETFSSPDVFEIMRLLPPRHRQAGPTWAMNIGTANAIRQFATTEGGLFWNSLAPSAPETLLGYPWVEVSAMDDSPDIDATASEDNFILFLGNWSRYVIVDRIGMNVELVPHLFGANNRPTGQRGLYAYMRSGAESVDDNAFRVLSVATTA